MKFSKIDLKLLIYHDKPEFNGKPLKYICHEEGEKRRWSSTDRLVFSYDEKFYETWYESGNTEYQEYEPFENEPDEIECKEVFLKEKIIKVYE